MLMACRLMRLPVSKTSLQTLRWKSIEGAKKMYAYVLRNRYIVLNNNLGEVEERIVLAHELGHDQLEGLLLSRFY